jgi:bifunctional UDP-N-acetylglucosamine pyrophosphorylase/glucosamine-1-phosphate N-acetyltransferase
MKSATPKVLHEIAGRSLLGHVVSACRELEPEHLVVVVGHGRDQVIPHLAAIDDGARIAVQEQQDGTGHALRIALDQLPDLEHLEGTIVVTCGDTPLLTGETLAGLVDAHAEQGNGVTLLSATLPDPTGYGRVLRDGEGSVASIVEQKDATPEQRQVSEINSGNYAFDAKLLREMLSRLTRDNVAGEEYLTDVIALLRDDGHRVGAVVAHDHEEILGVNDRVQLAHARRLLNDRLLETWMRSGVTVIDPATTWVDVAVTLEPDAVVHPGTQLHGTTSVGRGAQVGPNSTLRDTTVAERATVSNTTADRAEVGEGATVGPYAYLRPGTRLGADGKIGTFVETKNAQIGTGSKVPHLSYVGDATIGVHSNIGAASVFVNYDGVAKHHTTIGSHCRTGSDNMFVAPVTVGDGAYTGAGTVVRKDVPPGALAINVAPQRNLEGWVEEKRPGTAAAAAARRTTGAPGSGDQTHPGEGSGSGERVSPYDESTGEE